MARPVSLRRCTLAMESILSDHTSTIIPNSSAACANNGEGEGEGGMEDGEGKECIYSLTVEVEGPAALRK